MIVPIYARKSTEQTGVSDEEQSVTRQIAYAKAYALKKDWTVSDSGHTSRRPRLVATIPRSAAIGVAVTPGAAGIATASRLYSAENLCPCIMTPLLAHYEP